MRTGVTAPAGAALAVLTGRGLTAGADIALAAGGLVLLLALVLLTVRRVARPRGGPPAGPSLTELEADAECALIGTDDAVRTSDAELGFAVARFGEHSAEPFSAALKAARAQLAAAFRLRQRLDDNARAAEPEQRALLIEISIRCAAANRRLDEQSQAFDRFRDLEARAPRVLSEVDAHATQQSARLDKSRQILDQLAGKYSPQAVVVVAANPDQAAERLEFATGTLADARKALAADQASRAAVLLQAAESAADQTSDLLDGVEHLEAELTQAASALPAALREIDTDISEASALQAGRDAAERPALLAGAQAAAAMVRGHLGGWPFDSLAALRTLEQADEDLDQALASARDERDRQQRARAMLDQAMLLARSSVTAAGDFISTRRGGVRGPARTRLAEAQRLFRLAIADAQAAPASALTRARRTDALARRARVLAEQDVAQFRGGQHALAPGPGGYRAGLDGAILGGILIDSPHGDGLGPASFGGLGSRSRQRAGNQPLR